jgi:hypothetical protein
MVLSVVGRWEHAGTSSADGGGTVGDGPTLVAEDDIVIPLVVCTPGGTLVEYPGTSERRSKHGPLPLLLHRI